MPPYTSAAVLALQRTAGNAAVGRVLARQPADTDVKSSRRSVVIWEGRERGKRVKFKSKLSLRGQIPKGPDTIDSIVGATEAENVRRKSSALETEFIALDGDIWKLTPAAFQERMKKLGVKATIEFEPFDAAVKTADAGEYKLPSIDLMKFNAKFEWYAGKTVVEFELSASLSPTVLLGAADRKLLQQSERKVVELRNEMLELDKTKAQLVDATKRTEDAQKALDTAHQRAAERKGAVDKMKSARGELGKAQANRGAADRAAPASAATTRSRTSRPRTSAGTRTRSRVRSCWRRAPTRSPRWSARRSRRWRRSATRSRRSRPGSARSSGSPPTCRRTRSSGRPSASRARGPPRTASSGRSRTARRRSRSWASRPSTSPRRARAGSSRRSSARA